MSESCFAPNTIFENKVYMSPLKKTIRTPPHMTIDEYWAERLWRAWTLAGPSVALGTVWMLFTWGMYFFPWLLEVGPYFLFRWWTSDRQFYNDRYRRKKSKVWPCNCKYIWYFANREFDMWRIEFMDEEIPNIYADKRILR